jgi:hypothetical protein
MKILGIILLAAGIIFPPNPLPAQTAVISGDLTSGASTAPDSVVQITAEMQGLQSVQYSDLPAFGTYWEIMPGGSTAPLPCPPSDPSLPVYAITDNIFLVDCTYGQLVVNARQTAMMSATSATTTAVQAEATAVANLIDQVQSATTVGTTATAMAVSGIGIPFPGGGVDGVTNGSAGGGASVTIQNYGTNLWLAQTAVASGYLTGIGTNTIADVLYTIQSRTNLVQTDWQDEGDIVGSELTNWTPFSVVQQDRTSIFVRLRSDQSGDASGIPGWWEAQYFGTNTVNPNAQDSAGDGYTIYQKYEMGVAPGTWVTPIAPQNFSAEESSANVATLSWSPSSGPVTNYLITKYDWQTGNTTYFNTPSGTTTLIDNLSAEQPFDVSWTGPAIYIDYSATAQYAKGNSGASTITLGIQSSPNVSPVCDAQGRLNLAVLGLPSDVIGLKVYREKDESFSSSIGEDLYTGAGDYFFNITKVSDPLEDGYFEIPLSAKINGVWLIPTNDITPFGSYQFWVQGERSNGTNTEWSGNNTATWTANNDPFIDARQQLKDNLRFIFRATDQSAPFTFAATTEENNRNYVNAFQWATNYAYASCYCSGFRTDGENDTPYLFYSPSRPIEDNYALRNFACDPNSLGEYGFLNTGIYVGYFGFSSGFAQLFITNNPTWQFDVNTLLGSTTPVVPVSVLQTNETRWIYQFLTSDSADNNYYGLPYSSIMAVTTNANGQLVSTVYAMGASENNPLTQYFGVAQPVFASVGYYFARSSTDPMPEQDGFATTNITPLITQGVGTSQQIAGYNKLAVENGNPGVYGYLGQYFDQAYTMTNGVATGTNSGILSPYGGFFATQPGPVALITKPDVDPPYERGTCTVYCVSLQLDANHDGTMDLSFNGSDSTSWNFPFIFWADNNFDRWALDKDDGTNYMDDVYQYRMPAAGCPYSPNTPTPDCNYCDQYGLRQIPCTRDLQDFFRLWVCGITPGLLTNLPAGSTITLNWGDEGNPNAGNPTIDLFQAVEADGGIGYLTNETVAMQQINPVYSSHIGRLGPGQSIQLNSSYWSGWAGNHFLMCGVSNGTGGLNLTIKDGNGNVLAQSTSYLQILDIKQMYERWTVGENPKVAPLTNALPATEDLPLYTSAFRYSQSTDTNTSYILFVHGWNMERWEKDRFAETAFKRLYWQGYKGRFGVFRWPTDYGFTGDFTQLATSPQEKDNFDNSEQNAWLAGVGLLNKLNDLNAQYPSHVYVLAHSMGNVVTGEALRLAGSNQVVNTYVASQGAISAHTYDPTVANYSFTRGIPVFGTIVNFNLGPRTPNIYGNWFAGNYGGGAKKVVNYFNVNDFALSPTSWQLDQLFKPDALVAIGGALWSYEYGGGTNDPAPWNNFFKTNDYTSARVNFNIVSSSADHYEVFSHAAQSYTTALGATPNAHNVVGNVGLSTLWPSPDPVGSSYREHFWHSAEFRGDAVWEWDYWNTLLFSQAFGFNQGNP